MTEVDSTKIYYDIILYNNVKEKVNVCAMLKLTWKAALTEYNDVKSLRSYINMLKSQENIDFQREIKESEKKLKVLSESQ